MVQIYHLEVRAGDAGSYLFEERLLNPDELRRLYHIQDLLDLPEEHHLNGHGKEKKKNVLSALLVEER